MTVTVTVTNNGPGNLVGGNYSSVVTHGSPDLGNAKPNGSPAYRVISASSGLNCPEVVYNGVAGYCEFGANSLASGQSLTYSYEYLFQRCDQNLTVGQSYSAASDMFGPSISLLDNTKLNNSGGYGEANTTDSISDGTGENNSVSLDFNYKYTGCNFDTNPDTTGTNDIDKLKEAANTPATGAGETIAIIASVLTILVAALGVRYYVQKKKRTEESTK